MILRTSRHRPRVVLAGALAIAAGVSATVGSSGAMPVAAAGRVGTTPEAPAASSASYAAGSTESSAGASGAAGGHVMLGLKPPVKPVISAPVAVDTCPAVRAQLKQHPASGGEVAICATSAPLAVPSNTPAPARAGAQ